MRLLLDNGLPRSAVASLTASGIEAIHVGALGLADAGDRTIMERAVADGSAIVTLDADFHTLLSMSGAGRPSTIRIRIEGLKAQALGELIAKVIRRFENELREGAAISVDARGVRCHLLPIGKNLGAQPGTN